MNSKVWILALLFVVLFVYLASSATPATSKGATSKAATSKGATSKAATSKGATSKGATSKGATSKGATSKGATSKGATSKGATSKGATSKGATSKGATSKGATSKAAGGGGGGFTPLPSRSNQPKTICNTYSKALNITNLALMYTVIDAVSLQLFMPTNDLAQYFNGTTPPGSRDFVSEKNRDLAAGLNHRLIAFFGGLLGCTLDPHFPVFKKTANFRRLHQRMGITNAQFDEFNGVLISVCQSAGVAQADLTTMTAILETFRTRVVKQKRPQPGANSPAAPAGSGAAKSAAAKSGAAKSGAVKSKAAKTT